MYIRPALYRHSCRSSRSMNFFFGHAHSSTRIARVHGLVRIDYQGVARGERGGGETVGSSTTAPFFVIFRGGLVIFILGFSHRTSETTTSLRSIPLTAARVVSLPPRRTTPNISSAAAPVKKALRAAAPPQTERGILLFITAFSPACACVCVSPSESASYGCMCDPRRSTRKPPRQRQPTNDSENQKKTLKQPHVVSAPMCRRIRRECDGEKNDGARRRMDLCAALDPTCRVPSPPFQACRGDVYRRGARP